MAAFLLSAAIAPPAYADVLVLQPDGSLTRADNAGLILFAPDEPEPPAASFLSTEGGETVIVAASPVAAASASSPPRASAEILAEIEATGLRYAGHPALRQAGLSATEWLLLFQANIEIESGYNPGARSPVGAIGLGQLMPGTAALLRVNPHDWRANLDGSARYLLTQIERFGSAELALAAYNAGPEAVASYGGIPPYEETQGHVRKVMGVFARLTGVNSP